MPFGEYELSPSLIGLSLLHPPHPEAFQRLSVRASIPRYRDFTLDGRRSLGFASATADSTPSSGSLSLRLPASSRLTSPATATRRFIMQKARRHGRKPAPTACGRMVSGSLSLPSSGCFPPFPHGTCSLSVSRECLALPDGPGRFAQDSTCPALLRVPPAGGGVRVRGYHPLRQDFPVLSAPTPRRHTCGPATPARRRHRAGLGSSPFARHYWGNHCCFLFLRVLRCFSSPGSPIRRGAGRKAGGLPHSDTCGSRAGCASPQIFAASHVLRRLLEPRHPPCALAYFRDPHNKTVRCGSRPPFNGGPTACSLLSVAVLCASMSKIVAHRGDAPKAQCGEYRIRTDGLLHAMQAL